MKENNRNAPNLWTVGTCRGRCSSPEDPGRRDHRSNLPEHQAIPTREVKKFRIQPMLKQKVKKINFAAMLVSPTTLPRSAFNCIATFTFVT
jgi:hypothetical protein